MELKWTSISSSDNRKPDTSNPVRGSLRPQWIWLSGSLLLNLKERNTKEESLR